MTYASSRRMSRCGQAALIVLAFNLCRYAAIFLNQHTASGPGCAIDLAFSLLTSL
ncbi:hypothetical protein [Paenibacillus ginsengihumi]|jgi:hypothetical protein|uniref:hypothetical protein n=1 Tax=Paenibacillus ginsengihumi TaxID=431596 RepID=UPI00035D1984|nr:hypothetical protein [Paenibacillus ginsengihumi]